MIYISASEGDRGNRKMYSEHGRYVINIFTRKMVPITGRASSVL